MIDETTKQQILDTARIEEVVGDYIQLRKKGAGFIGLCPFHNDRSPSFHVSPSKNICKCFVCEAGGTPVSFIMQIEHKNYVEALKQLAQKYHIHVEEKEETEEDRKRRNKREQLYLANSVAHKFFQKQLLENTEGKTIALPYLAHRGIAPDTIATFQLGYSLSSRDALVQEIQSTGHSLDAFVEAGLCYAPQAETGAPAADRFRERIVFPVHTVSGRVVAFGGRIMGKKDRVAKYINSPESAIYSKSNELYGLFFAKRDIAKKNKCLLVEGYMDVIALHQVGITNVVATSGTALTPDQIKLIRRFAQNVTVIFDGDAAGIKAALRGVDLLLPAGLNLRVLLLPDQEDPDSFSRRYSVEEVQRYFEENEQDFISFKAGLLAEESKRDPQVRAAVISDILHSISLIPNAIQRTVYIQEVAQRFHIREQLLLQQVKGFRYQASRQSAAALPRYRAAQTTHKTATEENQDKAPHTADPYTDPPKIYERPLLELIIRYGEQPVQVYNTGQEQTEQVLGVISIAKLIAGELQGEGITIGTPIFKRIVKEAAVQLDLNPQLECSRHFANHPSQSISALAVDILSSRYKLNRRARQQLGLAEDEVISPEELAEQTSYALDSIKTEFIKQQIASVQKEIAQCQDSKRSQELMIELMRLNESKKILAKNLGERVILP